MRGGAVSIWTAQQRVGVTKVGGYCVAQGHIVLPFQMTTTAGHRPGGRVCRGQSDRGKGADGWGGLCWLRVEEGKLLVRGGVGKDIVCGEWVLGKGHMTFNTSLLRDSDRLLATGSGPPRHGSAQTGSPSPTAAPQNQAPPVLSPWKESWAPLLGPHGQVIKGALVNSAKQPCLGWGVMSPASPREDPWVPVPRQPQVTMIPSSWGSSDRR